jgi:hypothetical protein
MLRRAEAGGHTQAEKDTQPETLEKWKKAIEGISLKLEELAESEPLMSPSL